MKTLKTIGNVCLVLLSVLAVMVCLLFAWYSLFVERTTTGINNIGDQLAVDVKREEDLTEEEKANFEERWFMQANCYSNKSNNGVQLQELQFNYFTGWDLTQNQYRSVGMQYLGDFKTYGEEFETEDEVNASVQKDFFYYNTTNGVDWNGENSLGSSVGTELNRNTRFKIKIDNRPFELQLTGQFREWIRKPTTSFGEWFGDTSLGQALGVKQYIDHYYDYGDVFESVFNVLESSSYGFGDYYVVLDLSKFFTVREYNVETKQVETDTVTDFFETYAVMKVHYSENGAKKASQSIFNIISCDPTYGEVNTEYWQAKARYNVNFNSSYLNKSLFDYRYSEEFGGYFVGLSMDVKNIFINMPKTKIFVYLDLTSDIGKNVIGLDFNAFENVTIDTLSIIGSCSNFYLLDNSLTNTSLNTLKRSSAVNLVFSNNVINSEYVEVIL